MAHTYVRMYMPECAVYADTQNYQIQLLYVSYYVPVYVTV